MKKIGINDHDTFMKDLEDLSDEEQDDDDDIFMTKDRTNTNKQANSNLNATLEKNPFSNAFSNSNQTKVNLSGNYIEENKNDVTNNVSLLNNTKFNDLLKEIDNPLISNSQISKDSHIYHLISESNKYISEINPEINITFKLLKESYAERFPELASIILTPYEYASTVKLLGNSIDMSKVDLSYLPNNMQLSLNVVSSTTSGRVLSKEKLNTVLQYCSDIINMNHYKRKILNFIEGKMSSLCPNLTALIGANLAAKLVTAAGGIKELAKMPASNVLVMGAQRVNLEGFSTQGKLHMGFLSQLDEIQKTPEKFKIQMMRKYAGKAVLMARVDAFREIKDIAAVNENNNFDGDDDLNENNLNTNNSNSNYYERSLFSNTNLPKEGIQFKEEITKKMSKLIEPQQAVMNKPLPRPDDKPRKKRGGKRARSIKERYEMTEMRMMKNRIKFGADSEKEYRETGKGFGLLGVGGTGSKMKTTAKVQKINTKKQKMLTLESNQHNSNNNISKGTTSGLQSSVSFTPVEGIELINPNLYEKKFSNIKEKYFSSTSGFSTVINQRKKGSSNTNSTLYEI